MTPVRARLRAVDPWGPFLALVGAGVMILHGFEDGLGRDTGVYAYGAQQAADGVLPYESILNRAGPLSHLIPAIGVLGARLVGVDDLLGMRVLTLLLSVVVVWLLYLLGRDVFDSRLSGAVVATVFLTYESFLELATGGPRDKTMMLLFLVAAVLAVVRRRWLLAGVLVALATLTLQWSIAAAGGAALAGLLRLRGRELWSGLMRFTLGGVLTAAACAIGFWMAGAFPALLDAFLLIPARYTQQAGLRTYLAQHAGDLVHGWGPGIWVLAVGLLALLVAGVGRLLPPVRDRSGAPPGLVVAVGGAVGALLFAMRAFNGVGDAYSLLPFAAVGIGVLVQTLRARVPARTGRWLAIGVATSAVAGAAAVSATSGDQRLAIQRASVSSVLGVLPDATIQSFEAPDRKSVV